MAARICTHTHRLYLYEMKVLPHIDDVVVVILASGRVVLSLYLDPVLAAHARRAAVRAAAGCRDRRRRGGFIPMARVRKPKMLQVMLPDLHFVPGSFGDAAFTRTAFAALFMLVTRGVLCCIQLLSDWSILCLLLHHRYHIVLRTGPASRCWSGYHRSVIVAGFSWGSYESCFCCCSRCSPAGGSTWNNVLLTPDGT